MHSRAKQVTALFLPALLFGMLLLGACENDLNKIKEISAKLVSQPIDTARGVEIIYSDSAIVKGKVLTPLLIHYDYPETKQTKPYYTMPHGVKVYYYDKALKQICSIVSDSAVRRPKEDTYEFYRNVVATNEQGETFKSEELILDQGKKIVFSHKPVQITTLNGDVFNGIDFTSDDKLSRYDMKQFSGVFSVTDSLTK